MDERKINKIWLAEQLGISVQALYVKLRGEGAFSLEQAFKIKEVLRMTDDEFNEVFGLNDPPKMVYRSTKGEHDG